jgi:hypothetical protein
LPRGCAVLAGGLSLAYAVVAFAAWTGSGADAVRNVALSSLVCGSSALLALLLTGLTASTPSAPAGTLGAIAIGMGVPLASAVAFGFSGWLVVCFEIALVLETLVAVSVVARYRRPTGTPAAPTSYS